VAQQSRLKTMRTLSALLVLAVACLVTAGVAKLRHDDFLTGTELIGWASVSLTLLLGFTWPVRCKVKTTKRKACGNWAYGFLFGCAKVAGHRIEKFRVRLRFAHDDVKPVGRRQPKGSYALNQPVPRSEPMKVTVEDGVRGICAFWITAVSAVASVVQVIFIFVH